MPAPAYLPNPIHAALTTVNAPFARAHGRALRFQPGVLPFAAVPEPSAACLADLLPLLAVDEEIFLAADLGARLPLIAGLQHVTTLHGLQMRLVAALPASLSEERDEREERGENPPLVALTPDDAGEMIALNARLLPGLFGPRAPELGRFLGIRDPQTQRLIAMGGERLATPTDREVSAICTDPAHVGQGHAARITRAILRHHARLGAGSLLHVGAENARAICLYERLGFRSTGSIDFVKVRRFP